MLLTSPGTARVLVCLFSLHLGAFISTPFSQADEPPIKWTGSGSKTIPQFEVDPGLVIFRMEHEGKKTFQIDLQSVKGKFVAMPVSAEGNFSGSQAFHLEDGGKFVLDVTADGPWKITLEQPSPEKNLALPQTFTINGPMVTPFLKLKKGTTSVSISAKAGNKGDSLTAVLLNENGIPIRELGTLADNSPLQSSFDLESDGVCLINVTGSGKWTMNVSQP